MPRFADGPAVDGAPGRQEAAGAALDGARVLIVEDDAMISLVLADLLDELGCSVVGPSPQVEAALALVEEQAPTLDAVLLDLRLGSALAYPVAEALVARGVPFAFMTGADLARVDARFAAVPVLGKPFELEELEALLPTLLAGRGASADRAS